MAEFRGILSLFPVTQDIWSFSMVLTILFTISIPDKPVQVFISPPTAVLTGILAMLHTAV